MSTLQSGKMSNQSLPTNARAGEIAGGSHSQSEAPANANAQITCPNCGALFLVDEPRCPYCGALNPAGAEKAYLGALDDINDDTSELPDEAQKTINATIKGNAKRTISVVVIALAVLATLFFVFTCMDNRDEQQSLREYQAREAFRTQHFAELDKLYAAQNDAALSAYVWDLFEDPGFDALFSWEHADYLEVYDKYESIRYAAEELDKSELGLDDYVWLVSDALELARLDGDDEARTAALSAEEEKRAAPYRAYAMRYLQETLHMDQQEVAAFADEAKGADGCLQEEQLKQNLQVRLSALGILR